MAGEQLNRQEFHIRNLFTKSVTLYPTRAKIIRDISDIHLKPGSNELIVTGITSTADKNSILVEGTGSATITDLSVDLVPNPDVYEDIYPSDSDPDSDSDSDSETETPAIQALHDNIRELAKRKEDETEKQSSAQACLAVVENYARSLSTSRPERLQECVSCYREERAAAYKDYRASKEKIEEIMGQIEDLHKQLSKSEQTPLEEERAKEREKARRTRREKLKNKLTVKNERTSFWPTDVYRVTIRLDTDSSPISSRRGSTDSLLKPVSTSSEQSSSTTLKIAVSLSYITYSAKWEPRYDLNLDTSSNLGTIAFRAEYSNTTFETWSNAQLVLSTSQTNYQGMNENIPKMTPWHVRLSKGSDARNDVLRSREEMVSKMPLQGFRPHGQHQQPQAFGAGRIMNANSQMPRQATQQIKGGSLFGASVNQVPQQANVGGFGNVGSGNAFSNTTTAFGSSSVDVYQAPGAPVDAVIERAERADDLEYDPTITVDPAIEFQESTWEETGLTTTYDIPGSRTISPSKTTRRHKIVTLSLKDIYLSYICIPKLRPAAFLKVRVKNTSAITLLKGPAGLTLDGSFLGNTNLPQVSAGETFSVPLGVDPSVNVVYGRPTVKRSNLGIFQKEDNAAYTRAVTLTSTKKTGKPISLVVLDQVPVSEDDNLKIDILVPKNLQEEGNKVKAGEEIKDASVGKNGASTMNKKDEKWGECFATLRKGGEICWNVTLNPGRKVRLALEYEARHPASESILQV